MPLTGVRPPTPFPHPRVEFAVAVVLGPAASVVAAVMSPARFGEVGIPVPVPNPRLVPSRSASALRIEALFFACGGTRRPRRSAHTRGLLGEAHRMPSADTTCGIRRLGVSYGSLPGSTTTRLHLGESRRPTEFPSGLLSGDLSSKSRQEIVEDATRSLELHGSVFGTGDPSRTHAPRDRPCPAHRQQPARALRRA